MRSIGGASGIGAPLAPDRIGGDKFIRHIGDRLILDFHEGAGVTIRDLSGWGNDLTLAGSQDWRLGSFHLDGSSYFSITNALQAGLDMGLSDFMVAMRIKLTVPSASQPGFFAYLFEKYTAGQPYYDAYLDIGEELIAFAIAALPAFRYVRCSASYVDDLEWHDLIFVADRDSATGLKIFIDGAEVTYEVQNDPTSVGNLDNSGKFVVGAEAVFLDEWLNAQIDEVRVWNFGYGGLYIGPIGILQQYLYHKWKTN